MLITKPINKSFKKKRPGQPKRLETGSGVPELVVTHPERRPVDVERDASLLRLVAHHVSCLAIFQKDRSFVVDAGSSHDRP